MQLYLSSAGLGREAHRLPRLTNGGMNAALILNAQDANPDSSARQRYLIDMTTQLAVYGFNVKELDLRHYFGSQANIFPRISDANLIWCTGGNAFLLRRAMRLSRFDEAIMTRVGDKNFVYAGHSAGVCVATPTLSGIDLVDDPQVTASGYNEQIIWDGLNLFPYSIAPHYQSDHPESEAINSVIQYFIDNKMPFVALRDGEAIITSASAKMA